MRLNKVDSGDKILVLSCAATEMEEDVAHVVEESEERVVVAAVQSLFDDLEVYPVQIEIRVAHCRRVMRRKHLYLFK